MDPGYVQGSDANEHVSTLFSINPKIEEINSMNKQNTQNIIEKAHFFRCIPISNHLEKMSNNVGVVGIV